MNTISIIALSLVFGQGTFSWAAESSGNEKRNSRGKMVEAFFKRHDANRDGVVSFDEFRKGGRVKELEEKVQQKIFGRFDKNGDGKLLRKELEHLSRRHRHRGGFFRKLDTDGDKKITLDEFKASERIKKLDPEKVKKFFQRMDRNGDGVLSRDDRARHKSSRGGKGHHQLGGRDGKLSWEEFGKLPWHGKLSEEELDRHFEKKDRNGDGKVSRDEMRPRHGDGREKRGN